MEKGVALCNSRCDDRNLDWRRRDGLKNLYWLFLRLAPLLVGKYLATKGKKEATIVKSKGFV